MKRREMLLSTTAALAGRLLSTDTVLAQGVAPRKLGIVLYCLSHRNQYEKSKNSGVDLSDAIQFVEFCHSLGAAGVQVPIPVRDRSYTDELRGKIEAWDMHIDGIAGLPYEDADAGRFETEVKSAKAGGADVIRTVMMPGRRYEEYETMDEWHHHYRRGMAAVERAARVVSKHKIHLAIENHKEQRVSDLLNVLEHIGSEYVGVCFDTGNSFTLLEDPSEVAKAFAPYTWTVHLKDQAVQEYEDGFLFGDVKYGEGCLDLKTMVDVVRKGNPRAHFNLEMITRDPLKVPCLTEEYWATFPELPGRDLARTLRTVRSYRAERLPEVSTLPLEERVAVEADNVSSSLAYARQYLNL